MLILQYVYNLDPSLLNHLHWQYSLFHVKHLITYSASWRIDNWVTLLLKTNYYLQHANSRLLRDIPPASAASWGSYSLLLAFQKSKVESFCIHVDWNKFHWKKKQFYHYTVPILAFLKGYCAQGAWISMLVVKWFAVGCTYCVHYTCSSIVKCNSKNCWYNYTIIMHQYFIKSISNNKCQSFLKIQSWPYLSEIKK